MSLSQAATEFLTGRPAGVSAVSRSAGLLTSWVENGFNCTVRRDPAGLPYELVAERAGRGLRLTQSFTYSGGVLVGMTGDTIPTVFREEVMGGQSSVSGAVAAPGTLDASNAASYNGLPVNIAAGATMTVHDAAWALLPAGVAINVGQSGSATLAFSGTATKENASGTSATSVTLAASGVYALLPSPTGSPRFRLSGGASL